MKNKFLTIILYIIQAIPIPFSLISILGSIISLANIGMADSVANVVVAFLAMLFAGTYTITFFVSLAFTIAKKKIGFYSFLPVMHIIVTAGFIFLWGYI